MDTKRYSCGAAPRTHLRRTLAALPAMLVAVLALAPAAMEGDTFLVAPAEVIAGATFVVEVNVDMGASEFGAAQFSVSWDPSLFELDLAHGLLGVGGAGLGSSALFSPTAVNPLTPGQVIWNCLSLQGGHSGLLFASTVGLRALGGAGTVGTLDLQLDLLASQSGAVVPAGSTFPRPGMGDTLQIVGLILSCGDVDADTDIDIIDSLMAARAALGLVVLDAESRIRADVDSDLDVDILDSLAIAMSTLGLPIVLSCP